MTTLTSLARAVAVERGRAQRIRTVRHVHLSDRPLVFVPLMLAGEACAPLAAMVGDDRDKPRLLTVCEPRDRTRRFEFAAGLAEAVLAHIDGYTAREPGDGQPYADVPQLIVPNTAAVKFTALLGRSTRFRRTEGPYAVRATVPVLGRWLSFYSERTGHPLSSLLLPATVVLADHWACGQSATEDQHLAALLAWIAPPPGARGDEAARLAEDPAVWPPAGPATDPTFDSEVLADRIEAVRAAAMTGAGAVQRRAEAALADALATQLQPAWSLLWQAIDLLRGLPPGGHVESRWLGDRWAFTRQVEWLRDGGAPQPRRDSAVAAARRLAGMEAEQQQLTVQRAYDDPLVMAEHRMTGEAFQGTVMRVEHRIDASGKRRVPRPWITVETSDEVCAEPGAGLRSPDRPKQETAVVEVARVGDRTRVTLELRSKMGRSLTPEPGSVPAPGDAVCYTTLRDEYHQQPEFPDRENTPWTHGGPPPDCSPGDEDADEPWS